MNKEEELIDMARAADIDHHRLWNYDGTNRLESFARLVAAKEREAIWNILFEYAGRDDLTLEDESLLKHLADLLRARGHKGAVE